MTTNFKVQNIQCGGCANTIKVQLGDMKNITEVEVDQGQAIVTFAHKGESDIANVISKLDDIGFPVDQN